MAKTLNTWTLAGLMIGPILGSGVILLPPLAYEKLGSHALWAWVVILALGAAFATVFIRMALRTRSDSGIADLVAREWGPTWGRLASNYLTGAVTFGAVPVYLTAARLWPGDLAAGLTVVRPARSSPVVAPRKSAARAPTLSPPARSPGHTRAAVR